MFSICPIFISYDIVVIILTIYINFAKVLLIKKGIVMQKFNFNKLWISTRELLKITSIAESTLYRFIAEWTENGNDAKDMGRIRLSGMKSDRWDPRIFVGWLIKHKLEEPIKFDYDFKERETLKEILVFNNLPLNKQQQTGEKL